METGLWVINLILLAVICLWAVREDKAESDKNRDGRK